MDPEVLNRRAAEAQHKIKEPYTKMMRAVENGNRVKWIAAIKKFYDVAEPQTSYASLPEATRRQIEDQDNDDLKACCRELCTEAINRDYVSFISTGDVGNVGRDVYKTLL